MDRIRVKKRLRIFFFYNAPDLSDRLQSADLVVHIHDAHEDGIPAERISKLLQGDMPLFVHGKQADLKALFLEERKRLIDRRVLHIGADDMLSLSPLCERRADQRRIIRFRPSGGKDDLPRLHPESMRDLLSRPSEKPLRLQTLPVL